MDIIQNLTNTTFRDKWLFAFFQYGTKHKKIPTSLEKVLLRKLDILDNAKDERDLISPPSNNFEKLEPKQKNYYSIRVNKQYRLVFHYENNQINDLFLDDHSYKI
ncbi:type II toxin-antitoxin system RelE/ParE family toxin [Pasteurella skyensis]|uniref:Type II toxin-antitoxin system RelE/ParE family toxin n=1 Tax=Phocoenobacter skyensis TaxID=97481 RepID=A0AAJ6N8D0_9PAST|nr:type II toxin-antitoxin system RelE/ParE family toxin [Pasteurella skyensis]MDP8161940.1 type II toxin-antitoxin system RelE/ParE family toxin [Pasteurella skyensis]MDP8170283.1 type II toxin-antitoxin system RelE/ParE family toxin [Pasteurella skyensis]MDP8172096.1 type II toxin-antitoxin system RelE/ParE family toxin [Pasteurella skyensis]MDP8176556.1 type II toxin-antitoxin system RelE/ParE family toxin [Pasteurella skyensis]MDP8178444.1 type II toxin-antitoxin system RelE/ParE family to